MNKSKKGLLIALENVDYVDSIGISIFNSVYEVAKAQKKKVELLNSNEKVQKLLRVTKLDTLFIFENCVHIFGRNFFDVNPQISTTTTTSY